MSTIRLPEHAEIPAPSLEEVSAGVYAYIQLDGSWFLNNAGFIVAPDGVIVIDSTGTEARARAFRAALEATTPLPVRILINTHSHGDHTYGNFVFAPDAAIIGHERCRRDVIAGGPPARSRLFPGLDFGEIAVTPPFVTFEERLKVYAGDLEVELVYVAPAHTNSDAVAWIPERRLLFTGDIIFNGGTPFAMAGSIAGWLEALDRLRALDPERIVPGHGPVCGPEAIDAVSAYLRFVQEAAAEGLRAGKEPLELARGLDLGPFRRLLDPERLVPNLHRAYSELRGGPRGGPLDFARMAAEMIEYNGGRPLRCLA
jgi:cyclase